MLKRLFLAALTALPLALIPAPAAEQERAPQAEEAKTRLNKQEIIALMVQTGRMPRPQQESRMDSVWKHESDKTPRSDFLFCAALAYLDNPKAQVCLGDAFEKGRGIVEDLTEAYTWYAIAMDNPIADKEIQKQAQAARDRIIMRLQSAYPSPSEDDLDDQVKQQKSQIAQYKAELKKTKN